LIPGISVGKVLIQRDESTEDKRPVFYYAKLPDDIKDKKRVFVLDPMLATGGSASVCIAKLREVGVKPESITFINLVSVEKGLDRVLGDHPGVNVITASIDDGMNDHKYICPGLGDFGDRYFGSRLPQ
jgi:uracil phosphoribosyltransferase